MPRMPRVPPHATHATACHRVPSRAIACHRAPSRIPSRASGSSACARSSGSSAPSSMSVSARTPASKDAPSAAADMSRMLEELAQGVEGRPKAGLYFSCLARGPNLFGPDSEEVKMITNAFSDLPLVGFFANGEISNDRLYTYTGVLTTFS